MDNNLKIPLFSIYLSLEIGDYNVYMCTRYMLNTILNRGHGLWCLTIFQLYSGVSFIGGGNQKYPEKTTDLPQVSDKLYHIMLYPVHLI
jgi:hypothetical protein